MMGTPVKGDNFLNSTMMASFLPVIVSTFTGENEAIIL